MLYYDKKGKTIKVGDVLAVVETTDTHLYKSIDVVTRSKFNDDLLLGVSKVVGKFSLTVVDEPEWTVEADSCPVELKYYADDKRQQIIKNVEIIGNIDTNTEMFTVEYAMKHFGHLWTPSEMHRCLK